MSGELLAALSEVSRMRSQAACCGLIPRVSPFLKKRASPLWRIRYVTCHLSLINDICNDFCSKTVAFFGSSPHPHVELPTYRMAFIREQPFPPGYGGPGLLKPFCRLAATCL